uniref:Uncharacterized protein n=1 Tax=Caenorhabditis tropicalis TaxID=1561998 RepID=A0A1I7SY95_9PELO
MENVFAVPFSPNRPFTVHQYINALFQMVTSVAEGATNDDFRKLQVMANNAKASQEYHQAKEAAMAQAKLVKMTEELEEMSCEKLNKFQQHCADLHNQLNQRINQIEELTQQLAQKTEENENLKMSFKDRIEEEVRKAKPSVGEEIAELKKETLDLRKNNKTLMKQLSDKNSEIKDLKVQVKQLDDQVKDMELENSVYERNDCFSPEHIKIIEKRISEWQVERQSLIDDCNNRIKEAKDLETNKFREETEKLVNENKELRNDLKKINNTNEHSRICEKNLKEQLSRVQKENEELSSELKVTIEENKRNKFTLEQSYKKIEMLNNHIDSPRGKQMKYRNY